MRGEGSKSSSADDFTKSRRAEDYLTHDVACNAFGEEAPIVGSLTITWTKEGAPIDLYNFFQSLLPDESLGTARRAI